mmetsp:Transcript_137480/g.439276  ORF Transcript_137480/g.439276 Transcript_137480/m.439276 type:complete len:217 (-) Transcript_137480:237-887(-)
MLTIQDVAVLVPIHELVAGRNFRAQCTTIGEDGRNINELLHAPGFRCINQSLGAVEVDPFGQRVVVEELGPEDVEGVHGTGDVDDHRGIGELLRQLFRSPRLDEVVRHDRLLVLLRPPILVLHLGLLSSIPVAAVDGEASAEQVQNHPSPELAGGTGDEDLRLAVEKGSPLVALAFPERQASVRHHRPPAPVQLLLDAFFGPHCQWHHGGDSANRH